MSRRNIYIALGLVVAAAAWYLLAPAEGEGSSRSGGVVRRTQAGRVASGSRSPSAVKGFTEEDMNAQFAPAADQVQNAFRPLVVPKDSSKQAPKEAGLPPNQLPASFASGEEGWIFTGIVYEDGRPSALFENRTTGQGEYLKSGQSWRKLTVGKITPGTVTVAGPGGTIRTLVLMQDPPEPESGGSGRAIAGQLQVQPLNPLAGRASLPGTFVPMQAEAGTPDPVEGGEQSGDQVVPSEFRTEEKKNEIR
jgi:hypothetical protein